MGKNPGQLHCHIFNGFIPPRFPTHVKSFSTGIHSIQYNLSDDLFTDICTLSSLFSTHLNE